MEDPALSSQVQLGLIFKVDLLDPVIFCTWNSIFDLQSIIHSQQNLKVVAQSKSEKPFFLQSTFSFIANPILIQHPYVRFAA